MQSFIATAEKSKLQVDSIGFHHYGSPEPEDFIGLLDKVHQMYGRPIWVTEFAAADWQAKEGGPSNRYTEQQMIDFMQAVCKFMEETSWVRGYAWYPWGNPGAGRPSLRRCVTGFCLTVTRVIGVVSMDRRAFL
jgi:O-glycosyl hydrolase